MKSDIFIRPTRELFLQTLSFIVKERNRMEEEEKINYQRLSNHEILKD